MSKPVMSSLFSASGRRNRKSYLIFLLFVFLYHVLLISLLSISQGPIASTVVLIMFLAADISHLFVMEQRCRDFGWSGWSVLVYLIPFVGIIFSFVILFVHGTNGDNRYGSSPLEA